MVEERVTEVASRVRAMLAEINTVKPSVGSADYFIQVGQTKALNAVLAEIEGSE